MLPLLNCNIGALAGKRSRTQDLVDEAEAASAAFARHGRNDELDEVMSLLNGATRTADALAAAIDALDAHATRVLSVRRCTGTTYENGLADALAAAASDVLGFAVCVRAQRI